MTFQASWKLFLIFAWYQACGLDIVLGVKEKIGMALQSVILRCRLSVSKTKAMPRPWIRKLFEGFAGRSGFFVLLVRDREECKTHETSRLLKIVD